VSETGGDVHVIVEPEPAAEVAPDVITPVGDAYREELDALHNRVNGQETRLGELHGELGRAHSRIDEVAERAVGPEPAAEVVETEEPEPEHVGNGRGGGTTRKFGRRR